MPAPSQEGGRMECRGGAGPHSSQGNDVGRNRLSDLQTAVCSVFINSRTEREAAASWRGLAVGGFRRGVEGRLQG